MPYVDNLLVIRLHTNEHALTKSATNKVKIRLKDPEISIHALIKSATAKFPYLLESKQSIIGKSCSFFYHTMGHIQHLTIFAHIFP